MRRRRQCEARDAQFRVGGDGIFLQLAVGNQNHGHHRRRHRDFVGTDGRLRKLRQRNRKIVPLGVVAEHSRGVLDAVGPFDGRHPLGGVNNISADHDHGNVVAVRVINRHRSMLQTDDVMHDRRHDLARRLGIAVRDGDGNLFVAAENHLRIGFPSALIIDQRIVNAAEARPWIQRDILNAEYFEQIDDQI